MSFCSLHSGFHWLSLPLSGSQLLWNFAYMVLARLTRPSCSALTSLQISTFSVTTFCYYSTAKPIFKFFWDLNILSLVKGTIISGMEYANSLSISLIDFCALTTVYIQVCRQFLLSNTLTRFLARWKNFPDIWRSLSNLDWVIQNWSNNINRQFFCWFAIGFDAELGSNNILNNIWIQVFGQIAIQIIFGFRYFAEYKYK